MKKLLALLVALIMVLSCTVAMAEEVAQPAMITLPDMTITSDLIINQDAVAKVLPLLGIDEDQMALVQPVLTLLGSLGERLTVVDNGFQADLRLGGKDFVSVAGTVNETGMNLFSNLFPSYKLTMNFETIQNMLQSMMGGLSAAGNVDLTAAANALAGYTQEYITACMSAATLGETEVGEYEYADASFNTRTPIYVDLEAISAAEQAFMNKVANDETILGAINALQSAGLNISADTLKEVTETAIPVDQLPDVEVYVYNTVDEEGNASDITYVTVNVTPKGAESPATMVNTLVEGAAHVSVDIIVPDEQTYINVSVDSDDETGINVRLDANVGDNYGGAALIVALGDIITVDGALFYQDPEGALASVHTTIEQGGQLTLDVSGEGKTEVAVETLMQDADAVQALTSDVMGAAMGLLPAVMEVVPELSSLIGAFTGAAA